MSRNLLYMLIQLLIGILCGTSGAYIYSSSDLNPSLFDSILYSLSSLTGFLVPLIPLMTISEFAFWIVVVAPALGAVVGFNYKNFINNGSWTKR